MLSSFPGTSDKQHPQKTHRFFDISFLQIKKKARRLRLRNKKEHINSTAGRDAIDEFFCKLMKFCPTTQNDTMNLQGL